MANQWFEKITTKLSAFGLCVRAVSVFAMIDDAKRLLKLPKFKNANIAMVELKPQDGKIKKTFKKSHYSWWRSKSFDVNKTKIV